MSATLRVSDFAENTTLFPTPPPIINVPARQHPVTVHFSRRTAPDYVTEAIRKTSKIHARLPPGGILIFLTGQNEISGACKKLEARYGAKALADRKKRRNASNPTRVAAGQKEELRPIVVPSQADVEAEDMDLGTEQKDLALDVDGDNADVDMDEDALDSDDDPDNEELGIDAEESEGEIPTCISRRRAHSHTQFPCTSFRYMLFYRTRSKCKSSSHLQKAIVLLWCRPTWQRRRLLSQASDMSWIVDERKR